MSSDVPFSRNVGAARVLSAVWPGLGQIYCGAVARGALVAVTFWLSWGLFFALVVLAQVAVALGPFMALSSKAPREPSGGDVFLAVVVVLLSLGAPAAVWWWGVRDAARVAERLNADDEAARFRDAELLKRRADAMSRPLGAAVEGEKYGPPASWNPR